MSDYLVISSSLNPESNSRKLCRLVFDQLSKSQPATWIDLQDLRLPICDGNAAYAHGDVGPLGEQIRQAKCVLVGTPIYNYYACASAKNLIELTGRAWTEKVVGFLCAAGGRSSYMSIMSLANSLMLDFRCIVIPRFVYAEQSLFGADGQPTEEIGKRIDDLAKAAIKITSALQSG